MRWRSVDSDSVMGTDLPADDVALDSLADGRVSFTSSRSARGPDSDDPVRRQQTPLNPIQVLGIRMHTQAISQHDGVRQPIRRWRRSWVPGRF